MADYELVINSFRGHNINDGTEYVAFFVDNEVNPFNGPTASIIETPRPGAPPVHVRAQPDGQRLVVDVQLKGGFDQDGLDLLKQWFSIYGDEGYLVATDGNNVQRRILCAVERIELLSVTEVRAFLRSATGLWEAVTATTDTEVVTASGQTFDLTNAGSAPAKPVFTITPNTVMAAANSWIYRRRMTLANRSLRGLSDPVGDGYPIDLGANAFDTDALNTAGKIQADLDDLRVLLNGGEIHRWVDPSGDDATTKAWCNFVMRPRRTVNFAADMSAVSPANGGEIEVSATSPEGLVGWPQSGFIVVENECIQYNARTSTKFLDVTRGARNTTAAIHLKASASIYWVEHPFLDIIYGYSAAISPAPPNDRKPIIDLALSLNTEHHWTGPFGNLGTRRSRAWQALSTDDGPTSGAIRWNKLSNDLVFQDTPASPLHPRVNNLVMECPIPVSDAAAAVELDFDIDNNLLLHIYLLDEEGNESLLSAEQPQAAAVDQQFEPDAAAYRVRLNARIGSIAGHKALSGIDLTLSDAANSGGWRFVLDKETTINGIVLAAKETSASTANINIFISSDDNDAPDVSTSHASAAIANASLSGSYAYFFTSIGPVTLPAGIYWVNLQKSSSSGTIDVRQEGTRRRARQYTREGGVNDYFRSPDGWLTTLADDILATEAQADAALETDEEITIDNIELNLDSTFTPRIVMAAEESLYLHNFRLQNDTTGDYLDVFMPCRVGAESVEIDCEARTIIDLETGVSIPFALEASNPEEWLTVEPGVNQFSYTEVGLVSVDVDHSFRSRWL